MDYAQYIENDRLNKIIDPAMYSFLFEAQEWRDNIATIYSCQGHSKGDPAWIRFDVKKKEAWDNFITRCFDTGFCEAKKDTLYIYHKSKRELFYQLKKIKEIGDMLLCQKLKQEKS